MKHVGYLIKEPGRDPDYPRYEFDKQDLTDADREYGFTSEPVYTVDAVDRWIVKRMTAICFWVAMFAGSIGVLMGRFL